MKTSMKISRLCQNNQYELFICNWSNSGTYFNCLLSFLISYIFDKVITYLIQKQPSRGILMKWCSQNMQQIYRGTLMPKCEFNKVYLLKLRHWCSHVNLLHIFRTPFTKSTSGRLMLIMYQTKIWTLTCQAS